MKRKVTRDQIRSVFNFFIAIQKELDTRQKAKTKLQIPADQQSAFTLHSFGLLY